MMEATEDGFLIAEKDLELRGGGEVLGARQSGMPEFRVADVPNFEELLAAARDDARLVLSQDPHLTSPRGEALTVRCSTSSNATRPCASSGRGETSRRSGARLGEGKAWVKRRDRDANETCMDPRPKWRG